MRRVAKVPMWASIFVPILLGIVFPLWGVLLAPPLLAVLYAYKRKMEHHALAGAHAIISVRLHSFRGYPVISSSGESCAIHDL
jgi:hypothetical protein